MLDQILASIIGNLPEASEWSAATFHSVPAWAGVELAPGLAWVNHVLGIVGEYITLSQALAGTTVVVGIGYVVRFFRFWRYQTKHIQEASGYIPPIPRLWARLLGYVLVRIVARVRIGPVKIRDNKAARRVRGRYNFVVVSNHRRYDDGIVFGKLAKMYRWRFMVAIEEVRRKFPLPFFKSIKVPAAAFFALAGAIPVVRPKSDAAGTVANPTRAAAAAIVGSVNAITGDKNASLRERGLVGSLALIALFVLTYVQHIWWLAIPLAVLASLSFFDLFLRQATHFLIFPQGRLVEDDNLRLEDFQRGGPVKIARRLQKENGRPVAFLPEYIHYIFGPDGKLRGAVVYSGEVFSLDELAQGKDDDAIMEALFNEIVRLKNKAMAEFGTHSSAVAQAYCHD